MITKDQGVVICGGGLDPKWDVSKLTQTYYNTVVKKVRKIMREMGICNVWREFNAKLRDYTFYSSPHKTYSRIISLCKDIGLELEEWTLAQCT